MISIRARLLLAASSLLLVFVALSGAALENAFRDSALAAQEARLRALVYALLGAAEPDAQGQLTLSLDALPEPRLRQPGSGLEAALVDEAGLELWRSPGGSGPLPVVIGPEVGAWKFERLPDDGRFVLSFGLRWISDRDRPARYTVMVLEDPDDFEAQLGVFRRTLWSWLLGTAAVLLLTLLALLAWGLAPLRRLVRELRQVESGDAPQVGSGYPGELTPLTGALNAMIVNERNQQQRYRNALGDLAHSLKTPLAVLRGLSADARLDGEARRQLDEQVGRMLDIVDHQLTRAATAGRRTLTRRVALRPVAEKIALALGKVHANRSVSFELAVNPALDARVDPGDLYEMLGNTLDNAGKWARSRVRLEAHFEAQTLVLAVEDDGPGFPADAERLLGRGVRADSQVPGQGLGLAAVAEIVQAYDGRVELGRSTLGGARVVLRLAAG